MATNDNTLKTLGFIYQTYIALIKCMEMEEGDKVIIEEKGDVTIISSRNKSQQLEVKHHMKATALRDRSDEVWNTVWNWYNNFGEYRQIDEFILYTTCNVPKTSNFFNWESKTEDEKYEAMELIGKVVKTREKTFRELYSKIFNDTTDVTRLKIILNKFKILSEQQMIDEILKQYTNYFRLLGEKQNRENFISSLIGYLLNMPVKQKKWEITYEEFDLIFKELALKYQPNRIPLPLTFEEYSVSNAEEEIVKSKTFVKEIEGIDLKEEVPSAISDYCKAHNTVIKYFENSIVKRKDLSVYKDELKNALIYNKKIKRLDCQNESEILRQSQRLYYESMAMQVRNINAFSENRSFFQKGIIHSIVDEKKLKWNVGEKE
ncbi:MAG: hypothetical protein KHY44_14995 [Clostridiales bacterium]|jgi:antitoxin component of MazEF toxin-antitoxin module|nr:hypothetical protein [Clostridiales bacterium]